MIGFPFDPEHFAGPMAVIALKTYSTQTFKVKSGKKLAFKLLSPDCVNFKELQYQADCLNKELEEIKKKGKTFFEKEKERMKKHRETRQR
jgi:hypothetical protein